MSGKKYRSIKLSEVRAGDEVYSMLRGWMLASTFSDQYPIKAIDRANKVFSYTINGKAFDTDLNPELTEARREVKVVTREMWGTMAKDGTIFHSKVQSTPDKALNYIHAQYPSANQEFIPVRITWEEEEPCQQ